MRHSGRTFRPPGPESPPGLLPDFWGFGASAEPPAVTPAVPRSGARRLRPVEARGRRVRVIHAQPASADPLARLVERIGRLFG